MKKILAIAAASLAASAMAYTAPSIGVTTITATSKNTIIPVPFLSLSDGTTPITPTELVKTNGLPNATWLLAYNGSSYNAWQYSGGVWVSAIYSDGAVTSVVKDASSVALSCGGAIWIVLPTAESYSTSITVYGAYSSGVTSTVTGGTAAVANLIANPLQNSATMTVASPVSGDEIIIPSGSAFARYAYKTPKSGDAAWICNGAVVASLPTFNMGQGFWYVRTAGAEGTTITWATTGN